MSLDKRIQTREDHLRLGHGAHYCGSVSMIAGSEKTLSNHILQIVREHDSSLDAEGGAGKVAGVNMKKLLETIYEHFKRGIAMYYQEMIKLERSIEHCDADLAAHALSEREKEASLEALQKDIEGLEADLATQEKARDFKEELERIAKVVTATGATLLSTSSSCCSGIQGLNAVINAKEEEVVRERERLVALDTRVAASEAVFDNAMVLLRELRSVMEGGEAEKEEDEEEDDQEEKEEEEGDKDGDGDYNYEGGVEEEEETGDANATASEISRQQRNKDKGNRTTRKRGRERDEE